MFRKVNLPDDVTGLLYLHSMPGRYEDWNKFVSEVHVKAINFIVCLVSEVEIQSKSTTYAKARSNQTLLCQTENFPIKDFSAPPPDCRAKFKEFIGRIVGNLRLGKNILIHCGAGIGRTGTVAICVLLEIGVRDIEAKQIVKIAGAHPEVPDQEDLITWYSYGSRM